MADPTPKPVALEAARDRAVRDLSRHYAADHIGDDELERRLDAAYAATSLDALRSLTSDLPAVRADATPVVETTALAKPARVASVPERETIGAVMGGARRMGSWAVASELNVIAVMGGAELDFREARFGPGVTEVNVFALMGGVEILVPPTVRVEMNGLAFMGGYELKGIGADDTDPDAPVVRIGGFVMMGGVEVSVRLPGENARDAKKRARLAKEELRRLARGK